MAFKVAFFCASALLVQAAFGQYIPSGSYFSDNAIIDNDIYIGGGSAYGLGGLGFGNVGLGNVGIGSVGLGNIGLGNVGVGTVGLGSYGLGSVGLGSYGLGLGSSIGSISAGSVGGLSVAAGSPLAITSISPIGPSGLAVASENVIQGNLLVTGQLPFLSAVAFEGALPTAGSGVATCGCGNGQVGITSVGFGGFPGSVIY